MRGNDNADFDDYTVLKLQLDAAQGSRESTADYRLTDHYSLCGTVGQGAWGGCRSVSTIAVGDRKAMTPLLTSLLTRYPDAELFAATIAPGTITAVAPAKYAEAIGADTSRLEHNRLALELTEPILSRVYEAPEGFDAVTLVVPIKRGKTTPGFLSARFKAAEFLGKLVPAGLQTQERAVWIIQDDGFFLYDTDTDEIGENLFREERFDKIPELRQLARQIADQEAGIGYYHGPTHGSGRESNRIAAWQTVRPTKNRAWKVVVLEQWG